MNAARGSGRAGLPFGPLGAASRFVCVDMQRLFLRPGEWYCPAGLAILPTVGELARRGGERCLYTRFVTPYTADQAHGRWRHYYRRWGAVTRERLGDAALELQPPLHAPPRQVFDKTTHDAFASGGFAAFVADSGVDTLVLFGIETEVCVLATALAAVDRGIRVVIAGDAVASSDPAAHRACLELILPRFDRQIEVADSATILRAWSA